MLNHLSPGETIWPGHRLSDFQRFLTDMALPVLRQSRLRDLRPWLRQGGSERIQRCQGWFLDVTWCHHMPSLYHYHNDSEYVYMICICTYVYIMYIFWYTCVYTRTHTYIYIWYYIISIFIFICLLIDYNSIYLLIYWFPQKPYTYMILKPESLDVFTCEDHAGISEWIHGQWWKLAWSIRFCARSRRRS